jgi:hypothetical protein
MLKNVVFWVITPCSFVAGYQYELGGPKGGKMGGGGVK